MSPGAPPLPASTRAPGSRVPRCLRSVLSAPVHRRPGPESGHAAARWRGAAVPPVRRMAGTTGLPVRPGLCAADGKCRQQRRPGRGSCIAGGCVRDRRRLCREGRRQRRGDAGADIHCRGTGGGRLRRGLGTVPAAATGFIPPGMRRGRDNLAAKGVGIRMPVPGRARRGVGVGRDGLFDCCDGGHARSRGVAVVASQAGKAGSGNKGQQDKRGQNGRPEQWPPECPAAASRRIRHDRTGSAFPSRPRALVRCPGIVRGPGPGRVSGRPTPQYGGYPVHLPRARPSRPLYVHPPALSPECSRAARPFRALR